MNDIKRIDIKEFRERGYLHEVNRLLLHPLGLALEVDVAEDGTETLGGVWDSRDDPEGVFYDEDLLSPEKASQVASEVEERGALRKAYLGFAVQPLPIDTKQLNVTVKEPFDEKGPTSPPYVRFAPNSGIEFPDDES